ncbi:hypothetical protein O0L34_g848 [Tuta absoluta]|nr:hypothetical protein O0L34_g848 [Tuta absoluta]
MSLVANNSAARSKTEINAIGFPEVEENPNLANRENRKPVYLPATCPENELYYPGDQKDDWICDCRPAYIYHPPSDKCWSAFKKGPCTDGNYLVLPSESVIPVCVKNPCVVDDFVQWNGKCERLGSIKPCEHLFPIAAALGVNATTLVVGCVRLNLEARFGEPRPTPPPSLPECPSGSRRSVNGKCVSLY